MGISPCCSIDLESVEQHGLTNWGTMRIWYDCEFLEQGPDYPIHLLSIGLVAADGRELYLINGEFPIDELLKHQWLMDNVVPHLPLQTYMLRMDGTGETFIEWDEDHPDYDAHVFNRRAITQRLTEFFDETQSPELWGFCASYDHVCLAQCFGTMTTFHHKLRYYTNDLAQLARELGIASHKLPDVDGDAHNALHDARWTKKAHEYIEGLKLGEWALGDSN